MSPLKATALRAALLFSVALIVLAIVCTITIMGIMSLLNALTTALSAYIGVTGAALFTGILCLLPLFVLLFFLLRLYRNASQSFNNSTGEGGQSNGANNAAINIIKGNPWEAASLAFLFGFTYKSDPQLRAVVMQEGLDRLKASPPAASKDTD